MACGMTVLTRAARLRHFTLAALFVLLRPTMADFFFYVIVLTLYHRSAVSPELLISSASTRLRSTAGQPLPPSLLLAAALARKSPLQVPLIVALTCDVTYCSYRIELYGFAAD